MTLLRKVISCLAFTIAAVGLLLVAKTELRKWFVYSGREPQAAQFVAWVAWSMMLGGWTIGYWLWPRRPRAPGAGKDTR